MQLYLLSIDNRPVVEVTIELPAWFPVKPRIDRRWFRGAVGMALRRYFHVLR